MLSQEMPQESQLLLTDPFHAYAVFLLLLLFVIIFLLRP